MSTTTTFTDVEIFVKFIYKILNNGPKKTIISTENVRNFAIYNLLDTF